MGLETDYSRPSVAELANGLSFLPLPHPQLLFMACDRTTLSPLSVIILVEEQKFCSCWLRGCERLTIL
jgi:hypothetical protein